MIGNDVSNIQGAINANGQVFLINPNGVLLSTTAQVNIGGLVASTRNITNEQFNAGDYRFEGNSSSAIINQGNIKTADGGYVVMIAAKIENAGTVTANQGTVAMGAGNLVTLDMGGPVKLKVEQGNINALIKNGGAISADGGHVLLTAKAAGDLAASVINNSGTIEATSLVSQGGQIVLLGDEITNSGTLAANGATGGGEVLIGGDWQGANADLYPHATKVTLTDTSKVSASATENGEGGKVVAWSGLNKTNGLTQVAGSIEAQGAGGQRGGFVETSGKELSVADGTVIKAKKWLIDPDNVTIESTGGAIGTASVSASVIESALVTADIEIQATNDITVNEAINIHTVDNEGYTVGGLTLIAGNDININKVITVGPNAYLTLNHGWNGTAWVSGNEGEVYGNGGKITFGMNTAKTDFVGKIAFAPNANVPDTENSTIYINEVEQTIIRDAAALQAMGEAANLTGNFVLANDIDLNGVTWTPIGAEHDDSDFYGLDFKGSFNGLGHTISNLTLSDVYKYTDGSGGQAAGLFGNIAGDANIAGVRLSNASVTNTASFTGEDAWNNSAAQTAALVGSARAEYEQQYDFVAAPTIHNNIVTDSTISSTGTGGDVGAIVGSARDTTISDSAVTSTTVSSANNYSVGGVVGNIYSSDEETKRSSVTDSYVADSTIKSAYGEVGGVVGYMEGVVVDNAMVKNSSIYTTGTIQGSYGAGGIVGDAEYDSEIKNSSVENSTIAAMQDAGGIVGYMDETQITNSFYDLSNTKIGDKTGVDVADNVAGVITFGGIDNAEYIAWLNGDKATLSAVSLLGAAVNGYYSIDNVSDFRKMLALAYDPANKFRLASSFTLDSGLYLPVLRGELDGNSKTISGLNVSQSYNSYIGLVGRLEGGTIKNLTLTSPTLNGYSYVGGIVGSATKNYDGTLSPTISNVTVNNFTFSHTREFDVASQHIDTGVYKIGAVAGSVDNGTLSNLSASGGTITVNLTANNEAFDDVDVDYVGGLIGQMDDSSLDTATSSVAIDIDVVAKAHTNNSADENGAYVSSIGGAIGDGDENSLIKNVTATGAIDIKATAETTLADDVEGDASIYNVGGFFGEMGDSYIKNGSATNTITLETNGEVGSVGGLTGYTSSSFYDTATTSGAITIKNGAGFVENIGGAFGEARESILKSVVSTRNITVEGSPSDGAENVGGLVGSADQTNIISSSYTGTIDVNGVEEAYNIGGLVGQNYGYITDTDFSDFGATIDASFTTEQKEAQKTALLAEYNLRADVIALKALGYTVDDSSWGNEGDDYYVNFSIVTPENTEWGVIKDSTASVNIKAQHAQNVGGLVGNMDTEDGGQIINGSVTALNGTSKVEGYSNVGGMVGYNSYGNITDSDAAINVKANSEDEANIGGLVGYNEGGSRTVELDVADIQDSYHTTQYETQEAAEAQLASVKQAYIDSLLAANPGYEDDTSDSDIYVTQIWGQEGYYIYGRPNIIKEQPLGAITNSYASGTVTSAGSNAGGLVGYMTESTITGSHATGAVIGTDNVGGLVGYNEYATIDTAYTIGTVTGTGDNAGGLVGYATGSEIIDSYHTTGKVTGSFNEDSGVGGLVGNLYDENSVSGSYATSEVEGVLGVGGLIGSAYSSSVENSYATGKVTATGMDYEGVRVAYAGGLAGGFAFGSLSQSYATGEVVANGIVAGGLLGNGYQNETIEESYATGKVTGTSQVGGLIGKESGSTISNVYSSGEVVASGDSIGSLMGQADGTTLTNSYASGKITLTGELERHSVNGLIGNKDATVANSFYDKTVNTGMADEADYGKSTTELKTLATYTTDLEDAAWDMGGENGHYPILGFQTEGAETTWVMAAGETPAPTEAPTSAPTEAPTASTQQTLDSAVNSALSVALSASKPPVQPMGVNNLPTNVMPPLTFIPPVGSAFGDSVAGVGGLSGGLAFIASTDAGAGQGGESLVPSVGNTVQAGLDPSGFMKVFVVRGGIKTVANDSENQ